MAGGRPADLVRHEHSGYSISTSKAIQKENVSPLLHHTSIKVSRPVGKDETTFSAELFHGEARICDKDGVAYPVILGKSFEINMNLS